MTESNPPSAGNLFAGVPTRFGGEVFTDLAHIGPVRIERIVSTGQATPQGEWLCQDEVEFVLVVSGAARLQFDGEAVERAMGPGDWIEIPARTRHRVVSTSQTGPTLWLAVHVAA